MPQDHSHRGKAELLRVVRSREILIDELNASHAALRSRLTAANALLQEAVRLVEGYHRPYGWDKLSDRIARHLRNEEG